MLRSLCWLAVLAVGSIPPLHAEINTKKRLTVELICRKETFVEPQVRSVEWHPDSRRISYFRKQESRGEAKSALWMYDIAEAKETLLVDAAQINKKLELDSYQWSPQGNALLLQGENDLWLYNVQTRAFRRLTNDPEAEEVPTFSPAGDRVAFVKNNNLFAIELKTGLLEKLTQDGNEATLNGKLDWVYEEELANRASKRAYEWSPDGRKLCYLRLDEARVPQYPIIDFLSLSATVTWQRYPKPGEPNPVPSIHVVTLGKAASGITAARPNEPVEYIFPKFSWTPDSRAVAYMTLDRPQTELQLHLWAPDSGTDEVLLKEEDPYWINVFEPPLFLKASSDFLWWSERTGFCHLYRFGRDGKLVKALTAGNWMVDLSRQSPGLSEEKGWIYFVATEKDVRERHLYRTRLDGSRFERISGDSGTYSLNCSPDGSYLLTRFSSSAQTPVLLLLKADGSKVAEIDRPKDHLAEYNLAKTEFLELQAHDGSMLYARLVKPVEFDPAKRYPVIVNVYGGPGAQIVRNSWGSLTPISYLLAQEGYLVWSLDNRGSWGRGHAWEASIFKNFGQRELEDQLIGVSYLKSLSYVDPARIGVWGWSYGGYMTLYALTHASDVFRCGVAGAPVTDYRSYDSIYTERYLKTPEENPEGYRASAPLEAAASLQAKLLIVHGTVDDNVHMQNSIAFINALTRADRPYEFHLQAAEDHGFERNNGSKAYLMERLLDFFRRNL
jgi:dipeptidyl-peptidase-4